MLHPAQKSRVAWILAVAMLVNFIISGYILMQELSLSTSISFGASDTCFINSTAGSGDCFTVQSSDYSSMFGIPVAGWGIMLFLFMTIALSAFARSIIHNKPIPYYEQQHFRRLLFFVFIVAFGFALWFVIAQLFIIQAICRYCLIIDIITIISAFAFFITFKKG